MPLFYHKNLSESENFFQLSEETSKHCIQVLRMQSGQLIELVNGLGLSATVAIVDAHKKHCSVQVQQFKKTEQTAKQHTIAISLIKNNARFEWFLEKATELGIACIVPLVCQRTERTNFKKERMEAILISAMLQSQQTWLPILQEPTEFTAFCKANNNTNKLIAHCEEGNKTDITNIAVSKNTTILIGPEGDFTPEEIALATQNNFVPVSLGNTRLRTETAGVVAATILQLVGE